MPDLTLSLADELHAHLAELASETGQSPTEFVITALIEKIEDTLYNAEMDAEADRRWAEFLQTGKSVSLDEVEKRLEQRLAGLSAPPG